MRAVQSANRKTAKAAQDKGSALFERLFESTPDATVVIDSDGRIQRANAQVEVLFGYRRDELIGRGVELLLPERFRKPHVGHRTNYYAAPRTRPMGAGVALLGRRKDGSEFPLDIMLSPIAVDDGVLVVAVARDITERKRIEHELREKNVELEKANLTKDRFLASMSHELRTPLNAVIGFTGTLLMKLPGPLTDDQDKQLRTIQTSARHLLSLINDLLDLAKIESGKVDIHIEPVACQSVIAEVAAAVAPLAERKGLRLETEIPTTELLVRTDRRALAQILLNLSNNAIKFTEKGTVRIAATQRQDNGWLVTEVSVADTGIGIKPEDQAKLFDAFAQFDPLTRRLGGTWLGLHLSQKLANLIGGRIAFHSEYGKGSTFTLALAPGDRVPQNT